MNIDLGRVIPLNKGVYSAVATYELNDIVAYNGNLYWCVSPTGALGVEPGTDSNVWKVSFTGEDLHTALQGYADTAVAAKEAAVTAKGQAETAKSQAEEASRSAAQSAATAQTYATGEENSAKKYAEDANYYRARAMQAYEDAHRAYEQAEHEAQSALGSAAMAAQSETNAAESERNADESATNAAASVASIASYTERSEAAWQNATTETANARTFARNADESATTANNAATAAATSATNAATSERNAAQSATEAEGHKEEIRSSLNRIQTNKANIDELYSSLNHLTDAVLQNTLSINEELAQEEHDRQSGDDALRTVLYGQIATNKNSIESLQTTTSKLDEKLASIDHLFHNRSIDILAQDGEELTTESDEVIRSYFIYLATDTSLTVSGYPADAAVIGKWHRDLEDLEDRHFRALLEMMLNNDNAEKARAEEEEANLASSIEAEVEERKSADELTDTRIAAIGNQLSDRIGTAEATIAANASDISDMREMLETSALVELSDQTGIALTTELGETISGNVPAVKTDRTLTQEHAPAESKAVGDAINRVSDDLANLRTLITEETVEFLATENGAGIVTQSSTTIEIVISTAKVGGQYTDFSDAKSLHIPMPRLATVNFLMPAWVTSKTVETKGYIQFWDGAGHYFQKEIIASAQGNTSMNFTKKHIKFDMCNNNGWDDDDTFNLKIGEWVIQDSFHLKAYQNDRFRGIAAVSYKLYDEIVKTRGFLKDRPWKKELIDYSGINIEIPIGSEGTVDDTALQTDSGARTFPDGFPCICYLNGDFYGIYSWQIKKSRKNMQMTKKTAEHIHLDGTINSTTILGGTIPWANNPNTDSFFEIRNPSPLYLMNGTKYDVDSNYGELMDETSDKYDSTNKDHVRTARTKTYLVSLSNTIGIIKNARTVYDASSKTAADLATFRSVFETYFDVESLIDYIVFSDVTGNSDGFSKNWQWAAYAKAPGQSDALKWYICPYDLDMTFGGDYRGERIRPPFTSHLGTSNTLPTYYVIHYYSDELNSRYKFLRDSGIITPEHIARMVNDWCDRIGQDNFELEFEKWQLGQTLPSGYHSGVPNDNVYRVYKWAETSISNMDVAYNYN